MNPPKHTPGPWAVGHDNRIHGGGGLIAVGAIGISIADLALIAAAPELAEALRYIAKTWPDSAAAKTALAAIAKAEARQ